jgi:hypothetical protein
LGEGFQKSNGLLRNVVCLLYLLELHKASFTNVRGDEEVKGDSMEMKQKRWWQARWVRKAGLFTKPGQKSITEFITKPTKKEEK